MTKVVKNLFYIIALLPLITQAQELMGVLPLKDGRVVYTAVVPVDGGSKQELYKRAKRWAVNTYKSAKDVIQLDDPEGGELILKGNFPSQFQTSFMTSTSATVDHTLKISVKDGKYKYEITDFHVGGYASGTSWGYDVEDMPKQGRGKATKRYFEEQLDPNVKAIIESLRVAMAQPGNSDW